MKGPISNYATLVFDCDGVVLDSNRIKTDAFYQAALPYGEAAAQALVDYHIARGGVSRYLKFQHFLDEIVPRSHAGPDLEALLEAYAAAVRIGLMECGIAPGLRELRATCPDQNWMIASGGDQDELRQIFAARDLDGLFNGGIFGSPDSKEIILAREAQSGNLQTPALFLGDSKYDHIAAAGAGLDFVFVSGWSEFDAWPEYTQRHGLSVVADLAALTAE